MQANIDMQDRIRITEMHKMGYNISQIANETGFTVSIIFIYDKVIEKIACVLIIDT